MPERIEFGLPTSALTGSAEPASRFAYSYWFTPLDNMGSNGRPVLTKAQFVYFFKVAGGTNDNLQQLWEAWHSANPVADTSNEGVRSFMGSGPPFVIRGDADTEYPSGNTASSDNSASSILHRPTDDVLLELLRSEVGLLFLDRTRIVPTGFAVGEHVYTLGLAPAEEAVLEQRCFLQVEDATETTDEDETSTEKEKGGSWTRDKADTIVGSDSATDTDGFTAGGSVGFEYGVKVGVQGQYADGTTTADTSSRTNSTKVVRTRTGKNVAKTRDLHKTVFRLSSVGRFEASARRTIRNPNPHTPIDLHMFKVMQRMRFSHERYGVRLCWSPFVKDPAGDFFMAEADMRKDLLAEAEKSVPLAPIPPEPVVAGVPGAAVVGLNPPMVELVHWKGAPGTDMSHDYILPVNVPVNMKWDGDVEFVKNSLRSTLTGAQRNISVYCVGDPWEVVGGGGIRTVFQRVHAGASWRLEGHSQLLVSLSAGVIPDTTSLSQAQAEARAAWDATRTRLLAEREAKLVEARELARVRFEEWRAQHQATLNPAQELLRRFINTMFPADARDEISELDLWEQVFDWELASARTYPGTWDGDGQLRDPSRPAADFINASWARLYLPVRPGFEEIALKWIFTRSRTGTAPTCIAELVEAVTGELEQWRIENLGGPEEVTVTKVVGQPCPTVTQKYICLGTWSDDLPTDGVHMEVTQSPTTAADVMTAGVSQAAIDRATADVAAAVADGNLRSALATADLSDPNVHVHIDKPEA